MAPRSRARGQIEIQRGLAGAAGACQAKRVAGRKSKEAGKLTHFAEGQFVLLAPPKGKRPPDKLPPKLEGPFVITKAVPERIHVRSLTGGNEFHASAERPRPPYECGVGPAVVAAKTPRNEHMAGHTIGHRLKAPRKSKANKNNPAHYEFLVSWVDFPSSYDSWEPFSALRSNRALDEYLATLPHPPSCLKE